MLINVDRMDQSNSITFKNMSTVFEQLLYRLTQSSCLGKYSNDFHTAS